MKKKILALLSVVTAIFAISGCEFANTSSENTSSIESSIVVENSSVQESSIENSSESHVENSSESSLDSSSIQESSSLVDSSSSSSSEIVPTPPVQEDTGVEQVDFTKATNVKDVTDQLTYLDGCPTTSTVQSNPAVLVIPVEFSDVTAARYGYTIEKLEKAFNGGEGTTDYYSVHDYFYTSSYGKLDLDITVWNEWFKPAQRSSYYARYDLGDQMVMDEALAALSKKTDLSKFDSDNNGMIDAVVLITTLKINADSIPTET